MIILTDKPGQLCNRLWAFSFFVAFALKNKVTLVILGLKEYQHLFDNLNQYENVRFRFSENKTFDKLLRLAYSRIKHSLSQPVGRRILPYFGIRMIAGKLNSEQVKALTSNQFFLVQSWDNYLDPQALIEHSDRIRLLFSPSRETVEKVNAFVSKARAGIDVLVGVHIRQGDYREYLNGRFFFTEDVYAAYMQKIVHNMDGKSVGFILCSNVQIDKGYFKKHTCFSIDNASAIDDLYALSQCDFILGPPSTYSMWASFLGRVPLKFIYEREGTIDIRDFSRILYQNVFENGKSL